MGDVLQSLHSLVEEASKQRPVQLSDLLRCVSNCDGSRAFDIVSHPDEPSGQNLTHRRARLNKNAAQKCCKTWVRHRVERRRGEAHQKSNPVDHGRPIRRSSSPNRGSECRLSKAGSTLIWLTLLSCSATAVSSHANACSLSPRPA